MANSRIGRQHCSKLGSADVYRGTEGGLCSSVLVRFRFMAGYWRRTNRDYRGGTGWCIAKMPRALPANRGRRISPPKSVGSVVSVPRWVLWVAIDQGPPDYRILHLRRRDISPRTLVRSHYQLCATLSTVWPEEVYF